jgi:membrane protein required for colicin V production
VISLSQLTPVDWGILVVLFCSIVLSLWRGFAREAVSLAGWVAAFVFANMFVAELASVLMRWIDNVTGSYIAAYALLFVGTLVLAGIIAKLSAQVVKVSGLSLLDRILGTVFGLARGIIIIVVAVYIIQHLLPPQDLQFLHRSQLMPYVDMLVQWVQMLFHDLRASTNQA